MAELNERQKTGLPIASTDLEMGFEDVIPLSHLLAGGMELPAADDLDDEALSAKLWELIDGLAQLRIYLHSTDHLSDRELYVFLLSELSEPSMMALDDPLGALHIDVIGSGSEEDIEIFLRHYAGAEDREFWLQHYTDEPIPEHQDPPYDRDCKLPQRQLGHFGEEEAAHIGAADDTIGR